MERLCHAASWLAAFGLDLRPLISLDGPQASTGSATAHAFLAYLLTKVECRLRDVRRATSGAAAGLRISADAAARLARLEALVAEQQQSLQAATRRVDKANLRFKLYSAELKKPLQQVGKQLRRSIAGTHDNGCLVPVFIHDDRACLPGLISLHV